MKNEPEESLIDKLWQEHLTTPFPKGFRGRSLDGIDFVMLDANIAGCVHTFLKRGTLSLYQTAILGLSYRDAGYVQSILHEEGVEHFWRLERLAELVLKVTVRKNNIGLKTDSETNF